MSAGDGAEGKLISSVEFESAKIRTFWSGQSNSDCRPQNGLSPSTANGLQFSTSAFGLRQHHRALPSALQLTRAAPPLHPYQPLELLPFSLLQLLR